MSIPESAPRGYAPDDLVPGERVFWTCPHTGIFRAGEVFSVAYGGGAWVIPDDASEAERCGIRLRVPKGGGELTVVPGPLGNGTFTDADSAMRTIWGAQKMKRWYSRRLPAKADIEREAKRRALELRCLGKPDQSYLVEKAAEFLLAEVGGKSRAA